MMGGEFHLLSLIGEVRFTGCAVADWKPASETVSLARKQNGEFCCSLGDYALDGLTLESQRLGHLDAAEFGQ
jgi:hypothetical protein